jgi:hypothetical protein
MPDLVTHGLAGHLTGRLVGMRRGVVLLVIGNCLPDLLSRLPVRIIGEINFRTGHFAEAYWYWMWMPGHLPAGLLLACYALSHLFTRERRMAAFFTLVAGSATHLFMDSFQRHASGGEPIFWPVTWQGYEIGLVSPEASLDWIPWLAGASVIVESLHQLLRRRRRTRLAAAPSAARERGDR